MKNFCSRSWDGSLCCRSESRRMNRYIRRSRCIRKVRWCTDRSGNLGPIKWNFYGHWRGYPENGDFHASKANYWQDLRFTPKFVGLFLGPYGGYFSYPNKIEQLSAQSHYLCCKIRSLVVRSSVVRSLAVVPLLQLAWLMWYIILLSSPDWCDIF
jgi:hypothetical protein